MADKVTVDITTGVGIFSFPHLSAADAEKNKNDKGEAVYDIQILIPKTQREDVHALLRAIKKVGEAKWGENWKKVRTPLRDGDKEAGDLTDDGTTKGEKYPERLGHYFLNARSTKPVGVFDRKRDIITDLSSVYGGCSGKIAVTFYPYSTSGNHGVGCGLNGVQLLVQGEAFGGGRPSVESMFDLEDELDEFDDDIDGDEYDDLEDEVEEVEEKPKRTAKKAAPAKKAATRRKPEPEPEEDELDEEEEDEFDDLDDLDEVEIDEDEDDLYDDLDEDEVDEEEEEEPAPKRRPAKKAAPAKKTAARRRA